MKAVLIVMIFLLGGCSAPFCVGRSCRLFGHEMLTKKCVREHNCKTRPLTEKERQELGW